MLRCALLLYLGEHTSCYVANFCCTSVNTLHVTLRASGVPSCYVAHFCCTRVNTLYVTLCTYEFVNRSEGQFTKMARRVQRGSLKVLAHSCAIDSC